MGRYVISNIGLKNSRNPYLQKLQKIGFILSKDSSSHKDPLEQLKKDFIGSLKIHGKSSQEHKFEAKDDIQPFLDKNFTFGERRLLTQHYSQGPMTIVTAPTSIIERFPNTGLMIKAPSYTSNMFRMNEDIYIRTIATDYPIMKAGKDGEQYKIGVLPGPVEILCKLTNKGFEIQKIDTDSKLIHDMLLGKNDVTPERIEREVQKSVLDNLYRKLELQKVELEKKRTKPVNPTQKDAAKLKASLKSTQSSPSPKDEKYQAVNEMMEHIRKYQSEEINGTTLLEKAIALDATAKTIKHVSLLALATQTFGRQATPSKTSKLFTEIREALEKIIIDSSATVEHTAMATTAVKPPPKAVGPSGSADTTKKDAENLGSLLDSMTAPAVTPAAATTAVAATVTATPKDHKPYKFIKNKNELLTLDNPFVKEGNKTLIFTRNERQDPLNSLFKDFSRDIKINRQTLDDYKKQKIHIETKEDLKKFLIDKFGEKNEIYLSNHYSQKQNGLLSDLLYAKYLSDTVTQTGDIPLYVQEYKKDTNIYMEKGDIYLRVYLESYQIRAEETHGLETFGYLSGPIEAVFKLTEQGFETLYIATNSDLINDLLLNNKNPPRDRVIFEAGIYNIEEILKNPPTDLTKTNQTALKAHLQNAKNAADDLFKQPDPLQSIKDKLKAELDDINIILASIGDANTVAKVLLIIEYMRLERTLPLAPKSPDHRLFQTAPAVLPTQTPPTAASTTSPKPGGKPDPKTQTG